MWRLILLLLTAFATCCGLLQPAVAEKRVALVIGNSVYQNAPRLPNPTNDAAALAAMFRSVKFDVVEARHDLNITEMRRAFRDFSDKARDADIAVVYYAGHGFEIGGINYLIPIDAVLERDSDAFDEAIPLDRALQVIEPAKQLRLVILDACRDNPFAKTMKRTMASRGLGRGLAGVEPDRPNTLVAFAAKGGSTAEDGAGAHSPFTTALLNHLVTPGIDLRKALGRVRDEVMKATGNRQEPFVYGSLGGADVSLVPTQPALATTGPGASGDPQDRIRRDYELALQLGTRDGWDTFLQQYPSGFYAGLAKGQLNKIAAEEARTAAAEKAKQAEAEKARVSAEQGSAGAQAKATADAKAAEAARLAAEKLKQEQQVKAEAAERARAAAEQAAAEKAKQVEAARLATEKEKLKQEQQAKAEATERTRAAAEQAATEATARAKATADAKAVDNAKNDEVKKSEQKPTELASLPSAADAAKPASQDAKPTSQDIARALQTQLRRVGCFTGNIDGDWKAPSQRAMERFNQGAAMKLDVRLASLDAIDAVKSKTARVCPLICEHGFRADGENCIKVTCKVGFEVGDDNTCQRNAEPKPVAKPKEPKPDTEKAKAAAAPQSNAQQFFCPNGLPCQRVRKGCHVEVPTGRTGIEVCP